MLVKTLRFVAGLALGLLLWWYGTPSYNAMLADASEPLLRMDEDLRNAFTAAADRFISVSGPDLRPVTIPGDQLTYNAILLFALFATLPLTRRVLAVFAASIAVLTITHVLAVVTSIQATYSRAAGMQDVWTWSEYMYRLAGMFGIAFACWWVALPVPGKKP
jgi:hypothetical protein